MERNIPNSSHNDKDRQDKRDRKKSPESRHRRHRSHSPHRERRRHHRSRDRKNRDHSPDRRRNSRSVSVEKPLTEEEARMRDAKCVFVSQLQVKATERDVEFYFGSLCEVVEVALIKEKSTGRSKGFGYVELATMDDVNKALMLSGLPFVWRDGTKGFSLTVRPSEAHKMYLERGSQTSLWPSSSSSLSAKNQTSNVELIEVVGPGSARCRVDGGPPVILPTHRGKPLNTRILFVGNLDKSLTEADLKEVFSSFGAVESVQLKTDPSSGASKGFAFVKYEETGAAANANDKLNGYELMGSRLTCNPVNDRTLNSGDGFGRGSGKDESWNSLDDDEPNGSGKGVSLGASGRIHLMSKLAGGAAQEWMANVPAPPGASLLASQSGVTPTRQIAILNMFDPATETAYNWEKEIEKDTMEECERFGKVVSCVVDKSSSTGRVVVTFQNVSDAKNCAASLQGRWFARRQVQVEFLPI